MPEKLPDLSDYDLLIFDCDGVLLDSNGLKADAFYRSVLEFGEGKAQAFREYHLENGGVSRFEKFRHFFSAIHPTADPEPERYMERYAALVREGYRTCPVTEGTLPLLETLENVPKYVVSGSEQQELREVLDERGLARFFREIYGSPATKIHNVEAHIPYRSKKVLFFGDARTDALCARRFGFDFAFVSGYTDWRWEEEPDFTLSRFSALLP